MQQKPPCQKLQQKRVIIALYSTRILGNVRPHFHGPVSLISIVNNKKGKAFHSHVMKVHSGTGGTAPLNIFHSNRQRFMVILTPGHFHPREEISLYPLKTWLGGAQKSVWTFWRTEKYIGPAGL
jgi:hypothetical protein